MHDVAVFVVVVVEVSLSVLSGLVSDVSEGTGFTPLAVESRRLAAEDSSLVLSEYGLKDHLLSAGEVEGGSSLVQFANSSLTSIGFPKVCRKVA